MKRYIIIGISFFTFALISGCSKSEEDKCKDKGKYWDTSTKECKEKASGGNGPAAITEAETKESCESKHGIWNAGNSTCKAVEYFMVIRSSDELFRVIVVLERNGVFDRQREINLSKNKCVKVPQSYLSRLIIRTQTSKWSVLSTDICNGSADSKCELGVYTLVSNGDDISLKTMTLDAERTDCQEFDDLEE